ncbi:hypothetical protein ACN47E_008139 [Coniothyrium glycines]
MGDERSREMVFSVWVSRLSRIHPLDPHSSTVANGQLGPWLRSLGPRTQRTWQRRPRRSRRLKLGRSQRPRPMGPLPLRTLLQLVDAQRVAHRALDRVVGRQRVSG